MEIKVKDLGMVEEKSQQEVEKELLEKHEEKQEGAEKDSPEKPNIKEAKDLGKENKEEESSAPPKDIKVDLSKKEKKIPEAPPEVKEEKKEEVVEQPPLNEEDVLSFIENKYGKKINSINELVEEQEKSEELPEDVMAYFKYKKETGRNIEDFVNMTKDIADVPADALLARYYKQTEVGLDDSDIKDLMEDKFGYDKEVDEEREVKKRMRAKKRELAKAKKYFADMQETYKVPLESKGTVSEQDAEQLKAYKQYLNEAQSIQEENKRKSEWFLNQTDQVFNNEFKGFEFDINNKKITYSPGDAAELKKSQSDISVFINRFLDDKGLMKDATGYHKALALAMNPERFAEFFYEQGKAEGIDDVVKNSKNVNLDIRKSPQSINKSQGVKVVSLSQNHGRGLKIRSTNKNRS